MEVPEYCGVLDCNNYGDKAHLVTRAVLSKLLWDEPALYIYLCRGHHVEQHTMGIESFCIKYDIMDKLSKARDYTRS